MSIRKVIVVLGILGIVSLSACGSGPAPDVPSDFSIILDAHSPIKSETATAQNVFIEIDTRGRVLNRYDTGGAIVYDEVGVVTFNNDQVLEWGEFQLSAEEVEGLWDTIKTNQFFSLTEDYRMSMGFAYAFIVVEAEGQRHVVDNIGMDLPQARAIVEYLAALLPEEAAIEYREGFLP